MNKELIELQLGDMATGVVILDEFYNKLGQTVFMDAKMNDVNLFACTFGSPLFKEKLEKVSNNGEVTYFVIRKIDEINSAMQERYLNLVKNREFQGYVLPSNVIVVFTINRKENVSTIFKELYHYCVVAF